MRAIALTATLAAASALVAVAVPATADAARGPAVRFSSAPSHVFPGKPAAAAVRVRGSRGRCSLSARYTGGAKQALGTVPVIGGVARWQWVVPSTTRAGKARLVARCGRAGGATRQLVVVGSVIARRISVGRRGWSARPASYRGTDVSYGVIIHNEAADRDAVAVTVLVNFVDAENRAFGSATTSIPSVAAGGDYALSGSLQFPAAAPVAKLEVVVQVRAWAMPGPRAPTLANLRFFPDDDDVSWLGSVEGELINDNPTLTMERAQLSAILLDAEGNVVGGVNGYANASLPPGARQVFKLTNGLRAIPWDRVASVMISVQATFRRPGA